MKQLRLTIFSNNCAEYNWEWCMDIGLLGAESNRI